ncbi:hypothetical protein J9317_06080 [Metabacillus sp. KIGAM252]|uniref:DUF4083 domain-containing protein n=1 Tax=Metabacillus flavus TaxID=2823519 RepID=A0ABS5LC57_9BACI|nr:hypothetical protein [Metabacillus flavus]MBS2968326.1 hypothetical protein [Metabacillus flavus]
MLATVQGHYNIGDIIFQLAAFLILIVFAAAVIVFAVKGVKGMKSRNVRLQRIEEKVDELAPESNEPVGFW